MTVQWYHIVFSLNLANEPNKLECYIILGWEVMPETNTEAYSAHFYVMKIFPSPVQLLYCIVGTGKNKI
jgi:hypothetical protein